MIVTTLPYRMKLNSFIFAAEQLVGHTELPPHFRSQLLGLLIAIEDHAEQLYPLNGEEVH